MKGTIFTLFFILFITTSAIGQLRPLHANDVSKLEAKFNVTVSDTANNSFFLQHPDIKQVWIIYRNRRPVRITPLLERFRLGSIKGESYDLEYEGDQYAFTYKYGEINFVLPQKKEINLNRKEKNKKHEILQAFVSEDSLQYQYEQRSLLIDVSKVDTIGVIGRTAEYLYDLNRVAKLVEKQLINNVTSDLDSAIVFSFKIDKQGSMSELQLEAGIQSIFSDCVKQHVFFDEKGKIKKWKPAMIYTSGQNVVSRVRVYARLNENGSVHISTTPRLFRFLAR